jgi:Fic family protein
MSSIDKIRSGNKTFYYLGKTIRIGPKKWKKVRIKLGTKKPSKKLISQKIKELKLELLDVYNVDYINADKLEVIDDFREVYQNHIKKIPKTIIDKEESDFTIRFTYNSNAIEGNRLTLRETFLVIKEKQIPSGAPPKDYNEAINGKEAFDLLKQYKGKLNIKFIEDINRILTKNTGVTYPGRIRFFPVKIEGTDFIPPDEADVPKLIDEMIEFYYNNKNKLHPFVMACLIHAKFVEIHPFEDGNGRTGRALMNWVLIKAEYPKMYVPVSQRQKYYESIDIHNKKDYKGYCNEMFEIMVEQINLSTKK